VSDGALPHLLGKSAGLFERRRHSEHGVGIFAGERYSGVRRAGLENHRLALRRASYIQRTGDFEKASLMVEPMQLVRIEETSRHAVAHKGVAPWTPRSTRPGASAASVLKTSATL